MQLNSSPFFRLEGSFRRGLANGRGTLKTAAEDKIEGDFVDHMPHGKVLMQRPNGERIEGQFRQANLLPALLKSSQMNAGPGCIHVRGLT